LNNKSFDLFNKSIFVSDDFNFIRNVHYLFKDKLSYYKINGLWFVSNEKISNIKSLENDNKFQLYNIQSSINKKSKLKNYLGFGWESDNNNQIIMNGFKSTLLFNFNNDCQNNKELILRFQKYFHQIKNPVILKVMLNENPHENITISNNFDYKINISKICEKNNGLKIDLIAHDPISLY
jgi:hypothetical protein